MAKRPLLAESGHSKRADSGSLNVRFGEKRTFGTKSVASAFWADRPDLGQAIHLDAGQNPVKLTEIHLDAVLVGEELADQVWQAWVRDGSAIWLPAISGWRPPI